MVLEGHDRDVCLKLFHLVPSPKITLYFLPYPPHIVWFSRLISHPSKPTLNSTKDTDDGEVVSGFGKDSSSSLAELDSK